MDSSSVEKTLRVRAEPYSCPEAADRQDPPSGFYFMSSLINSSVVSVSPTSAFFTVIEAAESMRTVDVTPIL